MFPWRPYILLSFGVVNSYAFRNVFCTVCVLQAIRYIVNQMDRYLLAQREYRTGCMVRIKHFIAKMCCIVGGKLYGNYLISGYMAVIFVYHTRGVTDASSSPVHGRQAHVPSQCRRPTLPP